MRLWLLVLALFVGGCTTTRDFAADTHRVPDRPVSIVVMRPDVEVGSLTAGGVVEPNADWTAQARASLLAALAADQRTRGNQVVVLADQSGDAQRTVADYENLHRAVAGQIAQFKYSGLVLPTKRGEFDWTLGSGVSRIGEISGGTSDYALFLNARDSFASTGRVVMQILGAALGAYIPGGQRFVYASLVDLRTGDIVWFNVLSSSSGDIRSEEGARSTVATLMRSMPSRGPDPSEETRRLRR